MITTAPFGRTGHESTRIIFGAAAFFKDVSQAEADKTLELLLEHGINHIDTAASYGESEVRLGPWMKNHRKDFFLATKTGKRTYKEAKAEFHQSLERLQVDSVDLLQLHYLVGEDEWEVAMGDGGALEMAVEARDQGLLKYIGVTGHDVAIAGMHQKSLDRFDFDSVLLPFSYTMMQNADYRAGFDSVLNISRERNIAVQTIKGICRRPWAEGAKRHASTWYEPLTEQEAIDNAVHWILGQEGVFLNSAGDIHLLPKILDAANRFDSRPSDEMMEQDVSRWEMAPLFT